MKRKVTISIIIIIIILAVVSMPKNLISLDIEGVSKTKQNQGLTFYHYKDKKIIVSQVRSDISISMAYEKIKNGLLKESFNPNRVKDYQLAEIINNSYVAQDYYHYVIGKDYVNGMIFKISNHNKDYTMGLFRQGKSLYYILTDLESYDGDFLNILDNIDISNYHGSPADNIISDITIYNGDIGVDSKGWKYTAKLKTLNETMEASEKLESENNLAININLVSHNENLEEATIKVRSVVEDKVYRQHDSMFFNLRKREVCDYSLIIPVDTSIKSDINKIIDNLEIYLDYKVSGEQKNVKLR